MTKVNKEKQAAMPQKRLLELFDYISTTGEWKWIKKPHPNSTVRVGQVAGHIDKRGYVSIQINRYHYYAHRLAWTYMYGDYPEGVEPLIDHINGNPSDNRIENLRVSSQSKNMKNVRMCVRNTSGIMGIKRRAKDNNSKKNPKINHYWIATWYNEKGKQCGKSFPVNTHGEEGAKQAAIDYRDEQLHLLEVNFGIVYTERHGTGSNDKTN